MKRSCELILVLGVLALAGGMFADWAAPRIIGPGKSISVYPVNSDSVLVFWGEDSLYRTTYSSGIWSEPVVMFDCNSYMIFSRTEAIEDSRGRLWVFGISGAGTEYYIDDPEDFPIRDGPDLFPMLAPDTSGNIYYLQKYYYWFEFGKSINDTIWSRNYPYLPGYPEKFYNCIYFNSNNTGLDFIWWIKDSSDHLVDTAAIIHSAINYDSPESTWLIFDTLAIFNNKVPLDAVPVTDGWIIALSEEFPFTFDSVDLHYYCSHITDDTITTEVLDSGSFWGHTSTYPQIKLAVNALGTDVSCIWKSPNAHVRDTFDGDFNTYSDIDYSNWTFSDGWNEPISLTSYNSIRFLTSTGTRNRMYGKPLVIDDDGNSWVCWYEWSIFTGSWCYLTHENPVSVTEKSLAIPNTFTISAHPNPFNSSVTITATVGAEIEVFDVNGRRVERIPPAPLIKGGVEQSETEGLYVWRPAPSLPSGVYLVRARLGSRSLSGGPRSEPRGAETTVATKRIVYLK